MSSSSHWGGENERWPSQLSSWQCRSAKTVKLRFRLQINDNVVSIRNVSDSIARSVSVSRDIAGSAETIFALLANPSMHPFIDGTGMTQSADGNSIITKVGDVFVMHMTHWNLGDYGMENHVVEFVPNERIVWQPLRHTYQHSEFPSGENMSTTRYWGWELEPLGPELTRVTEFYDASHLFEGLREFVKDGEFWRKGMVESLENLEKLVTTVASSEGISKGAAPFREVTKTRNYFQEVQAEA